MWLASQGKAKVVMQLSAPRFSTFACCDGSREWGVLVEDVVGLQCQVSLALQALPGNIGIHQEVGLFEFVTQVATGTNKTGLGAERPVLQLVMSLVLVVYFCTFTNVCVWMFVSFGLQ